MKDHFIHKQKWVVSALLLGMAFTLASFLTGAVKSPNQAWNMQEMSLAHLWENEPLVAEACGEHTVQEFELPPVLTLRESVLRDCSQLEPVLQNPDYPNGCEAASLATLLAYEGFEDALDEVAGRYLPNREFLYVGASRLGPDPERYYVGDPSNRSGGWYCFEQPLARAADAYLSAQGSSLRARVVTGASLPELEKHLAAGTPVAVWFTQNYQMPAYSEDFSWTLPSGEQYQPYSNLHCVVLTAADEDTCYLADPLWGKTQVDREMFEAVYTAMGSRALILA